MKRDDSCVGDTVTRDYIADTLIQRTQQDKHRLNHA